MDHDGIHELTAAYALDALDPAEEREFEEHLARCTACRGEVASLREVTTALAHNVDTPEPPAALRARLLQSVRAEQPKVVEFRPRRWSLPLAAGFAAAAACAAVGLGLWAAALQGRLNDRAETVALTGARGSLVVSPAGEGVLVVSRLAPAPTGKTYEAWVIEDGRASPAGLFDGTGRRTAIALTRLIPDGAIVAVTLEDDGGVKQPTGQPLFKSDRT
jgi:anti-sigma-K factor RskA